MIGNCLIYLCKVCMINLEIVKDYTLYEINRNDRGIKRFLLICFEI